jgi:hypothetical protein
MNIEISPKEYWKKLNYHDGLLYCTMVVIDNNTDWRMLKNIEEYRKCLSANAEIGIGSILEEDINLYSADFLRRRKFHIIPVRDII